MPSTGLSAYNFPHLSPGIPIKCYPHATDQETEIEGDENPHFRSQAECQMQDSNPHTPNSKAHVPRSRQQTKGNHSQLSPHIHSQATSARCGVVSGNQRDKGPAVTELTCSVPLTLFFQPGKNARTQFTRGSTRHRQGIQTGDRPHQAVTTRSVPCTGSLYLG